MTCDPPGIADASVVTVRIFAPSMITTGLLHTLWPSQSLPSFTAFVCSAGLACPQTRVAGKNEIPSAMAQLSSNPIRMFRFIWNCLLIGYLSRRPTLYARLTQSNTYAAGSLDISRFTSSGRGWLRLWRWLALRRCGGVLLGNRQLPFR